MGHPPGFGRVLSDGQPHTSPLGAHEGDTQGHVYGELLDFYMQRRDYQNVVAVCKNHGKADSNMWLRALLYFVQCPDSDFTAEIQVGHSWG